MGFLSLLKVASVPIVQVLIISMAGAFMATDYLKLLSNDSRRSLNKIVFVAFTPSLVFSSLAQTVRFHDIITWWFMPVNIGITFLIGGTLGWIAVKFLKPEPRIQNLVIAMCSAGNLGNILLIIIPAICKESGSPFGDKNVCSKVGISYVSFSMALGAFYIWSFAYHLIRSAGSEYKRMQQLNGDHGPTKEPNKDLEGNQISPLLNYESNHSNVSTVLRVLHQIGEELLSPPVVAAVIGFMFGAIAWLRNLIVGENAPLSVIYDSIKLLGDGTIPCITLILGGNLIQGLRNARVKWTVITAVICVRYIILPVAGICVVKAASNLGFLPSDPLYRFVLMIQFTLPPAMNIGTMTQLFDVAQEECAILYLWTYLAATLALTGWSSVFMWILT